MTDISAFLASLDPKTRERLKLATEVKEEKQPVPSLGLNNALDGGLGFGRQTLLWGNKSAGKSSFCLQLVGLAQKAGKSCFWIDVEKAYSPSWAEKMGVDNESLLVSDAKTTNSVTGTITDLMQAKADIIIVDSISTLIPMAFLGAEDELKALEDSKKMASIASDLAIANPMWNYANENTLLILISQHRNKIGQMFTELQPTGGETVKFMSSTIIKLFSTEAKAKALEGKIYSGDKIFTDYVGRPVNWIVEKNKQGPQSKSGQWDFYYAGDHVGIDSVAETLDYAEKYDVVKKGGAWYTVYDERFQGRDKTLDYLRNNDLVLNKVRDELNGIIN